MRWWIQHFWLLSCLGLVTIYPALVMAGICLELDPDSIRLQHTMLGVYVLGVIALYVDVRNLKQSEHVHRCEVCGDERYCYRRDCDCRQRRRLFCSKCV